MRTKIAKKWSFDAAHMLPNHDGKCRRLHGHTYSLEIVVEKPNGEVNKEVGKPQDGMVMDFYLISKVWKEHLEPQLDHQYLNETLAILTTSENISRWALKKFLYHGVPAVECTVWETPTSHATTYFDSIEYRKR